MNYKEIYLKGLEDAVKLLERGMTKGLSLADSFACLKSSVNRTKFETSLEQMEVDERALKDRECGR